MVGCSVAFAPLLGASVGTRTERIVTRAADADSSDSASTLSSSKSVSKGFGKKPEKVAKPKTAGAIERETAAQKYNDLAASGIPEYNIFVRVKGKGDSDWVPAGTMAVPRAEKIQNAVFEQQQALLKGVFRIFKKLESEKDNLEYGYNLKIYPDEPVKILEPVKRSEDAVKNWFESLLSPINASGGQK